MTVSIAALAMRAGPALAQDSAGTVTSADSPVIVQGQRNEVTDRIDRRVYDFRNDPDAQSGNAGDIDRIEVITNPSAA